MTQPQLNCIKGQSTFGCTCEKCQRELGEFVNKTFAPQLSVRERARNMFDEKFGKVEKYHQAYWSEPDAGGVQTAVPYKFTDESNHIKDFIDQIITLAQEEKIKEIEKLVIVPESTPHLSPYISGVNETIGKVVKILKQ